MDAILNQDIPAEHLTVNIAIPQESLDKDYENIITIPMDENPFDDESVKSKSKKSKNDFSLWAKRGENYSAVVDMSLSTHLPKGAYRIAFDRRYEEFVFKPCKINSDELYKFTENIGNEIINEVNSFWDKEDIYKKNNIIHKRGLLLAGPAGTGKSALITILMNQLLERDGIIFLINTVRELQDYYDCIGSIVRKVEPTRPIITIIEDVDKILKNYEEDDSPLLDLLDGKHASDHILTILTSNDTTSLSKALLRPSRIDMQFILKAPSDLTRKEFFIFKGFSEEKAANFADKTVGMSFAELKEVFISTEVLGKDLDTIIDSLKHPIQGQNYLESTNQIGL